MYSCRPADAEDQEEEAKGADQVYAPLKPLLTPCPGGSTEHLRPEACFVLLDVL
jgi:hypothetical protein